MQNKSEINFEIFSCEVVHVYRRQNFLIYMEINISFKNSDIRTKYDRNALPFDAPQKKKKLLFLIYTILFTHLYNTEKYLRFK